MSRTAGEGLARRLDLARSRIPSASLMTYEISGDGFLRHMVRAIVGSLVEVGIGRRDPAWMGELLTAGSRAAAGPTAPACGLWLVAVTY